MKSIDFVTFNIKGISGDVFKKALFLRNHGFDIYISNGNFYFNTANEYMKAYLLLQKYRMLDRTDKKLWMTELYKKSKYRRTLNKEYTHLVQGNNRVIMYRNENDFLSIIRQKNKKTGRYEYIVMAKNKDPDCMKMEKFISPRMSSYYISKDNPLFGLATTRHNIMKHNSKLIKENSSISFEPTTKGYLMNFKDFEPKSYFPGTCMLKIGEDNPVIAQVFKTLQARGACSRNRPVMKQMVKKNVA